MITLAQLSEILDQYHYSQSGRQLKRPPSEQKQIRQAQQRMWYERNKDAQYHRQKQRRFKQAME